MKKGHMAYNKDQLNLWPCNMINEQIARDKQMVQKEMVTEIRSHAGKNLFENYK